MSVRRLDGIPELTIVKASNVVGDDPEVLRLENLDTDIPPPQEALDATRAAIGRDDDNSYLPFTGQYDLCHAVSEHISDMTGLEYDPYSNIVITCGGTEALLDAMLALTDPGDEIILQDPTYMGIICKVKLIGAVPKFVPFVQQDGDWRLDIDALKSSVTEKTRALFLMSPSMPSGGYLTKEDWEAVANICIENDLWLVFIAAMERILFDNRPHINPATLDGMKDRTITIGSVSKEFRMIGWRVGWVAGPAAIISDITRVHIYNVVTPTGISQAGVAAALRSSQSGVKEAVSEWERRRDMVEAQLSEFPVRSTSGGWSLLLDAGELGLDSNEASRLLLEKGRVATAPMRHWGVVNGDQFVRIVYSNEPVDRLAELGDRVRRTFS
jgi:aspartate/methionine/tyrosine aminotransferase